VKRNIIAGSINIIQSWNDVNHETKKRSNLSSLRDCFFLIESENDKPATR
jgi:hypothetical protein